MFKRTRNVALSSVLIMGVALTGCGKNPNEKIAEDYANNISTPIEASDSEDVEEAEKLTKHIQFSTFDSTGKCELKADIDADATGYNVAKVYELTSPKMDDEYVKEIASKIFDNGTYTVEKPYAMLDVSELEAEKNYLEDKLKTMNNPDDSVDYEIFPLQEIGYYLDKGYQPEDYYDYDTPHDGVAFEQATMTDGEIVQSGKVFFDYKGTSACRLRGNIDGDECELSAYKGENILSIVSLCPHPVEIGYANMVEGSYVDENRVSMEEASKYATKFLGRIGKTSYEEISCSNLYVGKDYDVASVSATDFTGEKIKKNGYHFCYAYSENGLSVETKIYAVYDREKYKAFDTESKQTGDLNERTRLYNSFVANNVAYQDYVLVNVDEYGLKAASINGMYEVGKCVSDNVSLMDMDKVAESVKLYWETEDMHSGFGSVNDMKVTNMRFKYIAANYDGKYTLIPAWIVDIDCTAIDFGDDEPVIRFAVNALDGSIIESMEWM